VHCLVLDGVYRSDADGAPSFVEAGAPTNEELHALLQTVIARLMKMLTRRGERVEDLGQTHLTAGCRRRTDSPAHTPLARHGLRTPGDGHVAVPARAPLPERLRHCRNGMIFFAKDKELTAKESFRLPTRCSLPS
jgi:hypothetical protein